MQQCSGKAISCRVRLLQATVYAINAHFRTLFIIRRASVATRPGTYYDERCEQWQACSFAISSNRRQEQQHHHL